jgi:hypothetical protein
MMTNMYTGFLVDIGDKLNPPFGPGVLPKNSFDLLRAHLPQMQGNMLMTQDLEATSKSGSMCLTLYW